MTSSPRAGGGAPRSLAPVVWVLGSESDLPHVEGGLSLLQQLGIGYELRVLSAHRTPDEVAELARGARRAGASILIGVAGGAAHLAGVLAGHSSLPVIGVPVPTDLAGGLDSLLATVQMPSGVPVATVAANKAGGPNAALLAARILGIADPVLATRLDQHRSAMAERVREQDRAVGARLSEQQSK